MSFNEIGDLLVQKNILKKAATINQLVEFKNYDDDTLKMGKYTLNKDWSNNKLVNQLYIMRNQNIVDLYIPSLRNLNDLVKKISSQISINKDVFIQLFNNETLQNKLGFTKETFPTIIIPNTYEVYSNINEKELLDLFRNHYQLFWNNSRIKKAEKIGLSQSEVSILASIVQMEHVGSLDNIVIKKKAASCLPFLHDGKVHLQGQS